jgi:ABC-type polysaccharide/polyol phosphate export permease
VFGILGLGLVWGTLLKQDMNTFIPQLTVGLIVWQLIAGALTDGPQTFVRHAGMVRNVSMPSWFFSVRALAKHLINLMHNIIILVCVILYYKVPLNANTWLVLPGFFLVTLNLYWILHGLGLVGARFRDIELLITSLVPLLFFISPVIYRADQLPAALNVVWMNPFSYMIEAIRTPLLGNAPDPLTWYVLMAMLLIGSGLTWLHQKTQGKNLAFWV